MSRSPLRSVWFDPSQTIARIAHENPGYRLFVLPILAGFAVLPTTALFSTEDNAIVSGIFLSTLLTFGPVLEVLQVLVGAYLIRATGVWLGGKAGVESIQAAIAWGNVPIVALAILGIPLMAFSAFYAEFTGVPLSANQSSLVTVIGIVLIIIQVVIVAWSIGIFWKGLATVQGYSVGRAILNSILAWTVVAAIVVIGAAALGYTSNLEWLFFAGTDELVLLSGE